MLPASARPRARTTVRHRRKIDENIDRENVEEIITKIKAYEQYIVYNWRRFDGQQGRRRDGRVAQLQSTIPQAGEGTVAPSCFGAATKYQNRGVIGCNLCFTLLSRPLLGHFFHLLGDAIA